MQDKYLIPSAIVVAGFIIAAAVVYSNNAVPNQPNIAAVVGDVQEEDFGNLNSPTAENIKPVTGEDHIFGNPNAPVKLIEFSDFECPFCQRFHPTAKQVVEEYEGQVAWVYRHFPLESIHSRARPAAEASECANELGGNNAFWAYIDALFEDTSSTRLSESSLIQTAVRIGLDQGQFEACLESERHAGYVSNDIDDAVNSGGRGTPYSVVITENGDVFPFSGALQYEQVKAIINQALDQ